MILFKNLFKQSFLDSLLRIPALTRNLTTIKNINISSFETEPHYILTPGISV